MERDGSSWDEERCGRKDPWRMSANVYYDSPMSALSAFYERHVLGSPWLLIVLALSVLASYAFFGRLASPRVSIGKPAPDFVLPVVYNDDHGESVQLSSLEGEAVVLLFWASWCGPCRQTVPSVERLSNRLRDKGVVVVGVNTRDSPEKAVAYAHKAKVSFPIVSDADGRVGALFGVSSYPTIVVVDEEGVVAARRTGYVDAGTLESMVLSSRRGPGAMGSTSGSTP